MLLRDFHLPLFVTDKWIKCYCELILGLASLLLVYLVLRLGHNDPYERRTNDFLTVT